MMEKFFRLVLKGQRGAMFSMDARIALVIASVLAGVVGTQVVQRIERSRVEAAESGVQTLISGLENYYKTVSLNSIPPGDPSTFDSGTGNFKSVVIDTGIVPQANLATDPWDRDWVYETCRDTNVVIEGVQVTVHYAVLYSGGPNQTNESGSNDFLTNAACASNYAAWNTSADDIGVKFNTFDIERARVDEMKRKLVAIEGALQAYETSKFLENQSFCASTADPLLFRPRCDYNSDGEYITGEEISLNYFPRSSLDLSGADYYIPDGKTATGDEMSTVSYTESSMTSFLLMLGLSSDYVRDPWGRLLCYESNRTDHTQAPFTAKVEYTNSCSG